MQTITARAPCAICKGHGHTQQPDGQQEDCTAPDCDDGYMPPVELPTKWAICNECSGHGKSSAYIGALTEEDIERDWSPEEVDDYMHGGYDRTCEACKGSGKVIVVDEDQCPPDLLKAHLDYLQDEDEYNAICAAERRMGA